MMAAKSRAAIKEYSIAVAPLSSLKNLRNTIFIAIFIAIFLVTGHPRSLQGLDQFQKRRDQRLIRGRHREFPQPLRTNPSDRHMLHRLRDTLPTPTHI